MSTSPGTWRDEWTPACDGSVMMLPHSRPTYVAHPPRPRCASYGESPHTIEQCGEFDPPRPGFEPDPEAVISAAPLRSMRTADWRALFGDDA